MIITTALFLKNILMLFVIKGIKITRNFNAPLLNEKDISL